VFDAKARPSSQESRPRPARFFVPTPLRSYLPENPKVLINGYSSLRRNAWAICGYEPRQLDHRFAQPNSYHLKPIDCRLARFSRPPILLVNLHQRVMHDSVQGGSKLLSPGGFRFGAVGEGQ
jgi:hypothetical protein